MAQDDLTIGFAIGRDVIELVNDGTTPAAESRFGDEQGSVVWIFGDSDGIGLIRALPATQSNKSDSAPVYVRVTPHLRSRASMAATRSPVFGWLSNQAGIGAAPDCVSFSSFWNRDFCGSVPMPDLVRSAAA